MADLNKVWTTVGSAGTLNQVDLANVTLHESIIQLGTEVLPPLTAAPAVGMGPGGRVNFPTVQAVVRYNVTPVEGLFNVPPFKYNLLFRCRGQITANLIEVDFESGMETSRILFKSNNSPNFQVQSAFETPPIGENSTPLDFVNKAYYVEATLTASALVIGHPAAISIIKISAPTTSF
jgi:hypothetical protein